MIIRKATNDDVDNISRLIIEVTDKNPNQYSTEQIDAWKRYNTPSEIRKQMNDRLIFCALKDNKLIGTIALKEDFILGFYVSYSVHKIGIGTKLLNYLEKYASNNNIKKLKLTSTPSAFEFYEKRGYQIKGKVTSSLYEIDYPETEMEKIMTDKTYA
ncbi:MAG: GNAT family N-acetyltransferase [Bacteroidota bacterium]